MTPSKTAQPRANVFLKTDRRDGPAWYAKWRHVRYDGTTVQVKRFVGPAWVQEAPEGGWEPRRGRPKGDMLDRRAAELLAAEIVAQVEPEITEQERRQREHDEAPPTFREIATAWLAYVEDVKGAKPATLRPYRSMLAEPGTPHARGWARDAQGDVIRDEHGQPVRKTCTGLVMAHLGDLPAAEITTEQVDALLDAKAAEGVSERTVNGIREVVCAVFAWACQRRTYGLPHNPAAESRKRRVRRSAETRDYTVEEVEQLARTLAAGRHRTMRTKPPAVGIGPRSPEPVSAAERVERRREDEQDAALVRLLAFSGLRIGEAVALTWRDVNTERRTLHVRRAVSAGVELDETKTGADRIVTLSDQALAALDTLSRRPWFTSPSDYVAVGRAGGRLDPQAFYTRVRKAQRAAGMRELRVHDLRHTFGSLLVAANVDLVTVQAQLGHARLETTARYLHARDASEQAERFTAAFVPKASHGGHETPERAGATPTSASVP